MSNTALQGKELSRHDLTISGTSELVREHELRSCVRLGERVGVWRRWGFVGEWVRFEVVGVGGLLHDSLLWLAHITLLDFPYHTVCPTYHSLLAPRLK